jgi:hypothetical protein
VVTEKQIPGPFVGFDTAALEWRRQVKHHHVSLMVCEDGGEIVPADGLRPALEKGLDPGFISLGLFKHGWTPCSVTTQGRMKAGKSDNAGYEGG